MEPSPKTPFQVERVWSRHESPDRRAGMQKRPLISLRRALASLFRWMTAAIWLLLRAILIGWAALAIYYSNLPWWELRLGLAVAFTAFAIWVFWVSRRPLMYAAFAALFLGTLAW